MQPVTAHHAVGQRRAVMGAMGADGEDLIAAANKQHRLAADMARQFRAVGKVAFRDAPAEIRAFGFAFALRHDRLPFRAAFAPADVNPPC